MTTLRQERLLDLLEAYATDRGIEKELRRKMVALRCQLVADQGGRCYKVAQESMCSICSERSRLWVLFRERRRMNKVALRRVEILALRLSRPEEPEQPEAEEPKLLLELMK